MVTPLTVIDSESAFQRRTFAVTATGRVLRRLFTIVGEDHSDTKKAQRAHVADAQSPPWWQCLTVTYVMCTAYICVYICVYIYILFCKFCGFFARTVVPSE